MRRTPRPTVSAKDLLDSCISGVGHQTRRQTYKDARKKILKAGLRYETLGKSAKLYKLSPCKNTPEDPDPKIVKALPRSVMMKLYTQYLVGQNKPAREHYDRMLADVPRCPSCGGLGQSFTIDHHLAKTKFPAYAVLPVNLVPCCRDCNTDKGFTHATTEGEQTLHPYLDADYFFDTIWLRARIDVTTMPPTATYYVNPPKSWSPQNRERVERHVQEYKLGKRFATQAATQIVIEIDERRRLLSTLPANSYRDRLLEKSKLGNLGLNHWQRVLYRALAVTPDFYARTW